MCASMAELWPILYRTMADATPYYGQRYGKASHRALYHCIVCASSAAGDLAMVAGNGCEMDPKGTITQPSCKRHVPSCHGHVRVTLLDGLCTT